MSGKAKVTESVKMYTDSVLSQSKSIPVTITTFSGLADNKEHIALAYPFLDASPLVRVHSECLTGDVFSSQLCDCGPQLLESRKLLEGSGGILLYLRQEGRGIGLYKKITAYRLQNEGLDTYEANRAQGLPEDSRNFLVAAQMLKSMNVKSCRLITNNPEKMAALVDAGIDVIERLGTNVHKTAHNAHYLQSKKERGHQLNFTVR